jgi:hypothetical protein
VLDGADPGIGRLDDARRAVRVRRDRETGPGRLGDDQGELTGGELRLPHVGALGQPAAREHDLDAVDARGGVATDDSADLVGSRDLATQEPTVAAIAGQRRAGAEDVRADERSTRDLLPQSDGEVVPVAEVPNGRDALVEQPLCVCRHLLQQLAPGGGLHGRHGPRARVEGEVHM